jgi:hypothetical protein
MKTKLIAVCLIASAIGALLSLVRHLRVPADPTIEVLREVDIGNRNQSEAVEVSLPVCNRGMAQLYIRNVRTTCGCTSLVRNGDDRTRIDELTIPQRAREELMILVRVRGQGTEIHERIVFDTNDPLAPTVDILIKGKVFGCVRLSPPYLNFGKVTPGILPAPLLTGP